MKPKKDNIDTKKIAKIMCNSTINKIKNTTKR